MSVFYVSTTGCDTNPGTNELPFATIERAKQAVREQIAVGLNEDIRVLIEPGEYPTGSIRFDVHDSGNENFRVIYEKNGDEEVILNGGVRLNPADFVPLDPHEAERLHGEARRYTVKFDLKKIGLTAADWGRINTLGSYHTAHRYDDAISRPFACELFVNDSRMRLARYPNTDFLYSVKPIREGRGRDSAGNIAADWETVRNPASDINEIDVDTAHRAASWQTLDDVWLFGYLKYGWADASSPVVRVDPVSCELETAYCSRYGLRENFPYYFFNVFEELDAPGEWYLDRKDGILYLYPDCELSSADIILSISTEPLIQSEQTSYVTFDGLTIIGTRGSGMVLAGDHVTVENCTIKNVSSDAIVINGNHCLVRGCNISYTGCGGIRISGGDRVTLTPSGNIVENNHIHHVGEINKTYQPGIHLSGVACVVRHNCIHDSTHMAIAFAGNEHIIEYNEIYRVCLFADDSSAIYSGRDYSCCGNTIRYNYFHDMASSAECHIGVFSVYCDDNLGSCTITGNVFLRCQSSLLLHGGHDMTFTGNLILDAPENAQFSLRFHRYSYPRTLQPGGEHYTNLSRVPYLSDIWQKKYPRISEYLTWDPETEQRYPHNGNISNNIIINHRPIDINFDHKDERFCCKVENNLLFASRKEAGISDEELNASAFLHLSELMPDFDVIPFEKMGLTKN